LRQVLTRTQQGDTELMKLPNTMTAPGSVRLAKSVLLAGFFILTACSNEADKQTDRSQPVAMDATPEVALGRLIFHDATLSASGLQSCASCHSPLHAHAQPNALAVQLGGPAMDQPGTRAVPSLRYLARTPALSMDEAGTSSGGFNQDGSAATLAEQSERPLLAANEMANITRAAVVEKLRRAPYAAQFITVFGKGSLDDVNGAFNTMALALQQYQLLAPEFAPFDSRYDLYLAGKVQLTVAEARGLNLFNEEAKGNCAACHPSAKGDDGAPPLFTDFTYDSLGVPRNAAIAANVDAAHVDLGLCQSGRGGKFSQAAECGKFKVPTLRNVATRQVFFHNGQFKSLREAVAFYVQRDTHPAKWYPAAAGGRVKKIDDLPLAYHGNVNRDEAPYGLKPGDKPALSDQEIDDLVTFLATLNDGYGIK